MRLEVPVVVILLTLLPVIAHSFDAEFCGRGVLTAEELDRGHWEHHENVYVALVTKAELVYPDNRVHFSLNVDEIFKGDPGTTNSVYSQRIVNDWNSDIEMILLGGWINVYVGDRLPVFSNPGDNVSLGLCSGSRIIEQSFVGIDQEAAATLLRLRQWRSAL